MTPMNLLHQSACTAGKHLLYKGQCYTVDLALCWCTLPRCRPMKKEHLTQQVEEHCAAIFCVAVCSEVRCSRGTRPAVLRMFQGAALAHAAPGCPAQVTRPQQWQWCHFHTNPPENNKKKLKCEGLPNQGTSHAHTLLCCPVPNHRHQTVPFTLHHTTPTLDMSSLLLHNTVGTFKVIVLQQGNCAAASCCSTHPPSSPCPCPGTPGIESMTCGMMQHPGHHPLPLLLLPVLELLLRQVHCRITHEQVSVKQQWVTNMSVTCA